MSSSRFVRHHVAAALLLVPAAALLAAAPAVAQQREAAAVEIQSLVLDADHGLAPGSRLRLTLRGSPDARWVRVALGDVTVTLQPTGPGQYVGRHVVRQADRIDPMGVMTARLNKSDRTVTRTFTYPPAFQDMAAAPPAAGSPPPEGDRPVARSRERDEWPPQISDLLPANGARIREGGRVNIGARLSDQGSGVDPSRVRIRIDGRDVTDAARISDEDIRHREELPPGRHMLEVTVRDRADNATTKSWGFDVVAADPGR